MCSCAGGGIDNASVGPWFAGVCGEDRVGDDRVGDDQLLFLSGVGVARALRAAAAFCLRKPAYLVAPMAPARSAVLARIVSLFPNWKTEEVPSQAAAVFCMRAPNRLAEVLV